MASLTQIDPHHAGATSLLTMKVSVILPTLNEAENIIPLIEAILTEVPAVHEIIVVDDNSPDGTADLVQQFSQNRADRRVRAEKRLSNHGLTQSLRDGIQGSRGNVIVWMDCDFSMPPFVIPKLLRCIEQGYDIAVGSRFVRGGRFKEKTEGTPDSQLAVWLSRLMNYSIQLLLDHSFKDYTSGFIAIRRDIFNEILLRGNYGEYFIDLMFEAIRRGFRIIEVPYVCLPRQKGVSKTGQSLFQYLRLGSRYVRTALRLRWNALFSRVTRPRDAQEIIPVAKTSIHIVGMGSEHVPLAAGLHHRVLYQTLNSRLGIPFLEDLYGSLLLDPQARAWVATQEDRIIGFLSATLDTRTTQRHIMRSLYWRDRIIAGIHILTSVRELRDYISHQRLMRYSRRFGMKYPCILTMGIVPEAQGSGIALRMIEEADAFFSVSGHSSYYVDTLVSNHRALSFYKKAGFQQIGVCAGNVLLKKTL